MNELLKESHKPSFWLSFWENMCWKASHISVGSLSRSISSIYKLSRFKLRSEWFKFIKPSIFLLLIGCNCHISGSEDRVCDSKTGQCKCRPHVIGRTCDRCERGYWNIDSKKGCSQCSCHVNGSEDHSCDTHTGQCSCKPGVEGVSCDRCRSGYYGFSSSGCKRELATK